MSILLLKNDLRSLVFLQQKNIVFRVKQSDYFAISKTPLSLPSLLNKRFLI